MAETVTTPRTLLFRMPRPEDGGLVYAFITECGSLDLNSPYCYLLLCSDFAETCVVGEEDGAITAFLSAYIPPTRPDTIFVWQVGVHPSLRRQGVGGKLLRELLARPSCATTNFLEATITPTNRASFALFEALAAERDTRITQRRQFGREHFGPVEHDDETLVRVGPLQPTGGLSKR